MKLNYDCVRDVLLTLEENLTIDEEFTFTYLSIDDIAGFENLNEYKREDILYSLIMLEDAGFIDAQIVYADDTIDELFVSKIKYKGHEFLQSIKPEPVWIGVKNASKKVGTISFPIISSIASDILAKLITKSLGMP